MTNKIGIGIDATLNTSAIDAGLQSVTQKIDAVNQKGVDPVPAGAVDKAEALGDALNKVTQATSQAGKSAINPVTDKSIKNVDQLNRAFQQYMRIDNDFKRRAKASGQESVDYESFNWSKAYPNEAGRAKKQKAVDKWVNEQASDPGGGNRPPPQNHPFRDVAVNTARSGLSAAGPAGGVASQALGTGMSAGFGAGLMGLMGGMLALGVGKVVGSVVEKVGQAEDNSVALDRLKRTLGDVNVAFDALKAGVNGSGDQLKITYAEAGQLAAQFTKLGNVTGDQYKTLNDELGVGVGMSRSYGLDPGQGVGVMGQMRGLGVTKDVQESRRFALLIGETIGKSGAFAKADEVMESIASYAASQTRSNAGVANVAGYAGAFSSLVGSGVPGLDPSGAGALLSRINASLSAGGAKGEASQFFTGSVGTNMGLNPYQTRMLREGGAFATNDSMFGDGSAYERYKGRTGPKGGKTFLQGSLDRLKKEYGEGSDELAEATANHLGVGINQAMALLSVKPNEMGEMQKYGDLGKLNSSGIGNLSTALYGSKDERNGLAGSLLGRTGAGALDSKDRAELESAQKSGNDSLMRDVLARMAAKYGQEETDGSNIRDSKNLLDNIKVALADKLVPYAQDMRAGILYLAGGKSKTSGEVLKEIADGESKYKQKQISGEYVGKQDKLLQERSQLTNRLGGLNVDRLRVEHKNNPEKLAEKLREREDVLAALAANEKRQLELGKEEVTRLEKEKTRRDAELKGIDAAEDARLKLKDTEVTGSVVEPMTTGGFARMDRAGNFSGAAPAARPSGRTFSTGGGDSRPATGEAPGEGGTTLGYIPASITDPEERKNVAVMLEAISEVEGANAQTLVGQGKNNRVITDMSRHPETVGIVTPDGPSTAAGAFQTTKTTWNEQAPKVGAKDFSYESQVKVAVSLLERAGALEAAKKGDFDEVARKAGGTWQGLPTGASPNQGKRSWGEFDKAIAGAKERINKAATPPATGAMPGDGAMLAGASKPGAKPFDPNAVSPSSPGAAPQAATGAASPGGRPDAASAPGKAPVGAAAIVKAPMPIPVQRGADLPDLTPPRREDVPGSDQRGASAQPAAIPVSVQSNLQVELGPLAQRMLQVSQSQPQPVSTRYQSNWSRSA